MAKKIIFILMLCLNILSIRAQITTSVNPTIAQMQALLQGNGVVVSGLTITCPAGAYATFNNGAAALGGLNSGILLTTGTASNVAGPNPNTTSNNLDYSTTIGGAPGSPLGNTLSGGTTFDGCYINFLITPSCNTLSINYVFASEEYPEFVSSGVGGINDVFGFVISGPNPSGGNYNQQNISVIPGTSIPVSIQNVNNGIGNAGPCVNCAYYVPSPPFLEYDGKTTVLTASTAVTPCQTYTMTIGVWDDGDEILDSGVFLDVNGLSCVGSPTITATASPSTVCGPQTITLTASGGIASGTYTWSAPPSGGLTATNGTVVTANPTGTTTYTLAYSDINSCPGVPIIKTTTVTFTASAAMPISQTPTGTICAGQSATLTCNGGAGSYSWTPSAGLSTTTNSITVASPTVTTQYTVTKTSGSCSTSTVITVNVTSAAPITITPSPNTICSGQSATLTSTGSGPFIWTASIGANPPATGTVIVTPTANTTYTVVSGIGTCTATATTSINVSPAFSLTMTPTTTIICNGGSGANLSVSGGTTYTWSPSSSLNTSSGANVIANPSTTTIYTVTGSNGLCTTTAVATVSVSLGTTSVTATSSVYCLGAASVTLTASGATTYSWSPSAGLSSTSGAIVTATPTITTTYTVFGTSGSCISTKTITITVPPTASLSTTASNTLICSGNTTTITASGASTYTWLPIGSSLAAITVTPNITTTYTVTGQTAAGCIAIPAIITVSVSPVVNPTLTASSASICLSRTVALSAIPTGAGISYTWTPTSAIQGSANTATVIANPTTTGTTIYTLTISNGVCSKTGTVSVFALNCIPPDVSFGTLSNDSICTGGCVSFTNTTTGTQPITYQWLVSGATPATSFSLNPEFCFNAPGNYSVTLIGTNLYGTDTLTKTNYINVVNIPTSVTAFGDTTIRIGETAPINATGATYYNWFPNDGSVACPTCSNTIAQPTVTTQYIVIGSNSPYCKMQDTIVVNVDFLCDFFIPNAFSPNNDGHNDMVNIHGFCISTYNLQIFNRWGEKVFETSNLTNSWDGSFRGKPMDTGVFMYKVEGVTLDGKAFNLKGNITLIR